MLGVLGIAWPPSGLPLHPRVALSWFVLTAFDSGQALGFGCCKSERKQTSVETCCSPAAGLRGPGGFFQKACFKPVVFILCAYPSWEGTGSPGHTLPPLLSTDCTILTLSVGEKEKEKRGGASCPGLPLLLFSAWCSCETPTDWLGESEVLIGPECLKWESRS